MQHIFEHRRQSGVAPKTPGAFRTGTQQKGLGLADRAAAAPAASSSVPRLQRLADAGAADRPLTALQRIADARGTIQCISMAGAKQNFGDGRYATHMSGPFMGKHVAMEQPTTNVRAAEQHARRPAPPQTNTVIMEPAAFKKALAAGTWEPTQYNGRPQWKVVSNGTVELQDTRKRDALTAPPASIMLPIGKLAGDASKFKTNKKGEFTGLKGYDLSAAMIPKGMKSPVRGDDYEKEEARERFLKAIQANLDAEAGNAKLVWIKQHFDRIGGIAMHSNPAITSVDDVEQVPRRNTSVEVAVDQEKGEINHLQGTD